MANHNVRVPGALDRGGPRPPEPPRSRQSAGDRNKCAFHIRP